jgi:hypothetical protein
MTIDDDYDTLSTLLYPLMTISWQLGVASSPSSHFRTSTNTKCHHLEQRTTRKSRPIPFLSSFFLQRRLDFLRRSAMQCNRGRVTETGSVPEVGHPHPLTPLKDCCHLRRATLALHVPPAPAGARAPTV